VHITNGRIGGGGGGAGDGDGLARFSPSTSFVASSSARKVGSLSPSAVSENGPSTVHSLMKTATHASEVASALGQTLRERGREQTQMQSSIREYESRVSLLTAVVQRLEAEAARERAATAELKQELGAAELRVAQEQHSRAAAEAAAADADAEAAGAWREALREGEAAEKGRKEAEAERARCGQLEAAEERLRVEAAARDDENAALRAELAEVKALHVRACVWGSSDLLLMLFGLRFCSCACLLAYMLAGV
jgi:hypothetical protein